MATVYSLICFGGLSGKTVTFTDAGDVVNLANHGLRQGVTGIVFSTTGALPVGLTAGTTCYPRDGADTGKFMIYPTKADALAGTNQITFTGTGSGIHTVKSANMLAADLSRYGSTRVYDGMAAWKTARAAAGVQANDSEIAEIIDAYTEITTLKIQLDLTCFEQILTALVNGSRSDGFHRGVVGAGYVLKCTTALYDPILQPMRPKCTINGISVYVGNAYTYGIWLHDPASISVNSTLKNCIVFGTSNGCSGSVSGGIRISSSGCKVYNNIICGIGAGYYMESTVTGLMFYNNLAVKISGTGFNRASTVRAWLYSNVAIGCTTNWSAAPTSPYAMSKNAGISTDAPWNDGSGAITTLTTSHFVDYANNDFHPTSSSPLIDAGIEVFGEDAIDVTAAIRPNYEADTYPNNYWDVGPFEYDHGDGLVPIAATLTIAANVSLSGAEIRIYDADNTPAGTLGTELSGTESNPSTTYTYSASSLLNNTIYIQVMQSGYEEFLTLHTVTTINETLTLTLKSDVNA